MRKLFLDLDGVMADFDSHFPATFGVSHEDGMPKKEMWRLIMTVPDFFLTMPPMPGAKQAWESWLFHETDAILTACPSSAYAHVAAQKRAWVRKHLGQEVMVLPVNGSESKPHFMHAKGDILIDDWGKNCTAWEEAGGYAIKHESWSSTWEQVREADEQHRRNSGCTW